MIDELIDEDLMNSKKEWSYVRLCQVHRLQLVKDTYVGLIAATRHTLHCTRNNAIASL